MQIQVEMDLIPFEKAAAKNCCCCDMYAPMRAVIAFVAEYLYVGILVLEGLYLLLVFRDRWKELLGAALFIGLVAFGISLVAHRIIEDPRPFVVSGVQPLIQSSTDNGFPSDHTLLLAGTAAVILVVSPGIGFLGMVAAFTIGMARVYAGVHHVADVLGSLAIAAIAFVLYEGLIWFLKNRKRQIQRRRSRV
jgi:undecaprenyl-diphosphatase